MKQTVLVAAALLAGFIGGVLGSRVTRAGEENQPARVLRARSFELVDEAGKVISIWGVNKHGHTLLAFLRSEHVPGEKREHSLGLDDPLNQLAAIGVEGSAGLTFRGTDGKTRVMLGLGLWDKPGLMMADETSQRLALGLHQTDTPSAEDDIWALSFEPDVAWIGTSPRMEHGQKYVRGVLTVNKDGVKYP